jgi:arsenate reductase
MLEGKMPLSPDKIRKILFVCVENAGRSQIAEAFAKALGSSKIEVMSGGTMPENN